MKKIIAKNPWLLVHPNPDAEIRLYCFAYAGGSATVFRKWSENLPENVELCAIQLPGRGSRIRESLYTNLEDVICELHKVIAVSLQEKPFVFLGHSMGALMAFELCRELEQLPQHLIVSGHRAPQIPSQIDPIYQLPEQSFIEKIKELGGMQEQILANKELMNLLLPVLRADFQICDTYSYKPKEPLDCDITAIGGLKDPRVRKDSMELWKEQTNQFFSISMLPGDHFFLHSHENLYFEVVNRILYSLL